MQHPLRPVLWFRPAITAAILAACAHPALGGSVIWNVNASGSWTVPTNWSSNPSLPGPADNVLINQSNPITVSLSSGLQTVNSLIDDNILSLSSGGTLTVTSGLQVNGTFQLNGGTLQNTTLSVAPSAVVNFTSGTLANNTLSGTITQNSGTVILSGTVTNNANWTQTTSGSLLSISNITTLDGNGTITLLHATLQSAVGNATLNIGPNQTLQGSMNVLAPQILINNSGTISANVANTTISISYPSGTALNNGTLKSANGGTLSLGGNGSNYTLNNAGGLISATSLGNVTINSLNISGGQLSTDATGLISFQGSTALSGASASGNLLFSSVALANDTLSGTITQNSGTVVLSGTVTNNANWTQTTSGSLLSISNITTLDGNGTITLLHATLQSAVGNATLNIGPNQTLQGSMNVLAPQILINNSGTLSANVANTTISISYPSGTALNNGTLKSANGGTLSLNGNGSNYTLNNAGGLISATSLGNVTINSLNISGGQLSTDATGLISFQGSTALSGASASGNLLFSSVALANDTLSGTITQNSGTVILSGTVTNNANWTQTTSGSLLSISNITTLDGNGTITLLHATLQSAVGNATLNIGPNQTLQGSMNVLAPQILINNSGTISANVANTTISISYPSGTALNNGTLKSANGGTLSLNGNGSNYTLNNAGGLISATSLGNVTINSLNISGGQLSTDATGLISFQGSTALSGASASGNLLFSSVALANDTLSGTITQNSGTVILSGTVTNNANWTQTTSGSLLSISNITTLDGNGTITLLHATLQSAVGNATLNIGPNQTLQGSMNVLAPQILINNSGTINANQLATTLSFSGPSLTNTGLIEATNGASINVNGNFNNAGTLVIGPNSSLTAQLFMQSGMLAGSGTVNGHVFAGSLPHTIHPGMPGTTVPGTLTLSALSTGSATTLAFNLAAPEKISTPSSNDQLVIFGAGGLSLNGGTIAITSAPAGPASLGYYSIIRYTTSFTGSLASLSLPISTTPNVLYTLDTTRDSGFIDLHIGLLGDANDNGQVDLSDLSTILNNFGQPATSWLAGNFDGNATIDLTDLSDVLNNFGATVPIPATAITPTPEPGSLALTAATLTLLFKHRRMRR